MSALHADRLELITILKMVIIQSFLIMWQNSHCELSVRESTPPHEEEGRFDSEFTLAHFQPTPEDVKGTRRTGCPGIIFELASGPDT